ncbi:MAG: hypothetical protein JRI58_00675 [Deltaproteobacteria bacterium]|nr:hypothetical protein [Deltaproteobacteria bacterium]MBW2073250.1 hypothetical protein [Deltaproteobacteria bacterium]
MTRLETRGIMEYFKETVEKAAKQLQVEISDYTEFYLVDLLFRYTKMKALRNTEFISREKTFAELFLKSYEESSHRRARILKYIGDTTLFLTGFFSDSFQRSIVDIDYYANLGRTSYRNLLDLLTARVVRWGLEEVFDELSEKFLQLTDVLAEVSESGGRQHAGGLLRIYERWLRTRSKRDEALLRQKGIWPLEASPPSVLH